MHILTHFLHILSLFHSHFTPNFLSQPGVGRAGFFAHRLQHQKQVELGAIALAYCAFGVIKGRLLTFAELMQIEDQIDDLYLPYCVNLSQYDQLSNADLMAHIDRLGGDL